MTKTSFLGDKPINRIGFGAMQLAGPGVFGAPADVDGARAVLRRAIELGVDHIDPSQYYGPDIINREGAPIRDAAGEHQVAYVPFLPAGSAFPNGPATLAGDAAISKVAGKHGATPSQVALAWLLARYGRMLLIPGTKSIAHLEE